MREQLRDLTEKVYWVYGITEPDFDHAVDLAREMIDARTEQYEIEAAKVREESPDIAGDILDDVACYRYTDNQYLWQFALWRLQGLIEAVIAHQLMDVGAGKILFGLKAKLEALQSKGYTVEVEGIEELILWANLRNTLSRAPPEQYRPAPLREEDVVEYLGFVKDLYFRWNKEKTDAS
ncbi:hypothetical protein [Halomonas rhizosphaerae]|uniref:Uncharacterized protein n=1 Tax=Halomonas rhizosphaerae TaxID=3043296 RepID=A0ABT6V6L9_9GAMM|nr:hypothetical protein [Halomonas rhizosphaerae]MDI5892819.1 hypothetical protein [Halomonas rhizosphaerae]